MMAGTRKKLISNGVMTIPISPEMEALKIAEVTLSLAIETITTEDETVEGRQTRKNTESQILTYPESFTRG